VSATRAAYLAFLVAIKPLTTLVPSGDRRSRLWSANRFGLLASVATSALGFVLRFRVRDGLPLHVARRIGTTAC
jgi:hypothetical protein